MKKRLLSMFLAIIMVVGLIPASVFAVGTADSGAAAVSAAGQIGIAKDSWTEIGSYEDTPVYYLDASGNADATSVVFTDYTADDIFMIAGVKSNAMEMDTNEAPLAVGYSKTKDAIKEDTNWVFDDAHPLSGLGDNLYVYWVTTNDFDEFYVIVNAYKEEAPAPAPAAPEFTASVGGTVIAAEKIEKQENAYEYTIYEQDAQGNWNPAQRTMDLYVVTVPAGTAAVDFTFSNACLAYGYDDDKNLCTEGMDEYGGGTVGKTTATRSVDKDGDGLMDYVTVQSPYDASYNTVSFYAISFRYAEVWQGEGTAENPYKLATPEDLQALYDHVAAGKPTEGLYYKLVADITLPEGWKPIGVLIDPSVGHINKGKNLYAFSGTIDGEKADGSGCYTVTVPEGGLPLLAYVKGATVKNLNIYGPRIEGYGLINNMEGVGLSGSAVVIDNVTLKSGTQTLKSGLVGAVLNNNRFAGVSAKFETTIRNCTIEEGCVIGYNADQSEIGSFAGRLQGTIENCVSHATVKGKDSVGGIIGCRDNSMGNCIVKNCQFDGTVEGNKNVGGIVGSGYTGAFASNGVKITIENCQCAGTVTGTENVGGILGGDEKVVQAWNAYTLKDNSFTGKVSGTKNVGGIIGYYGSLNKNDGITGNYYSRGCGADRGIGFVLYVDTSCESHETDSGATYVNTANGKPGISGISKTNCNRTDDPLGADAANLCYTDAAPAAPEFTASVGGTVIAAEKIEKQEGAFEYTIYEQDAQGNWNPVQRFLDLYVVTVPAGTATVDFTFSNACLAYGYDDDKNLCTEGMDEYTNGTVGKTTATRSVDKDGDGLMDYVVVQSPYDANWVTVSFYAISFRYEETAPQLTAESVAVTTVHQDAGTGNSVPLTFDEETKTFSGKLSNYTDLEAYNDADISIVLTGLAEGTTAVLNNEAGEKIADFVDGIAKTTGNAVAKSGKHTFQIVLNNGGPGQTYTLILEKATSVHWEQLAFGGIPEFSGNSYYEQPEGTLFQLDENGNRTGKTGLSADCLHYEVYVSPQTMAVKPIGKNGLAIYKSSFKANGNYKTNIYKDDELLFDAPTGMALAMKWFQLKDGAELGPIRTVIRAEFRVSDTEIVNSTITFVKVMDPCAEIISQLEKLDEKALVYPDDAKKVSNLQALFAVLTDEQKAQVPEELQKKLNHAVEIMVPDRVPEKLEIVKPPFKLEYDKDTVFDPSGVELLAIYPDGTTRTITTESDGFRVEPTGALTDETEVTFIYNTARVKQPITILSVSWKGEGTAESPYELATQEDLKALNVYVSSGRPTEGLYYKVVADITLPEGWRPIGVLKDLSVGHIDKGKNLYAFSGTIDGEKADGSGCYTITVPAGGLPLLGYVKGATVKNLNIYGPRIEGYGLINNMEGVGLSGSAVVIDNVTLKSGTQTLKSGLVGSVLRNNPFAGVSAGFVTTIRNCTIEEGCVIGYNADQSEIGSFAGRLQGIIENCVSHATVKGKNSVGGIIGSRDNALGNCIVRNCQFDGTVEGNKNVGGIVGSGYTGGGAPNGVKITIDNCKCAGTVTGTENVGGILGGDEKVVQPWNEYTIKDNSFTGKVSGTKNVGGIIGYYGSLNKCDGITGNYYSAKCGADRGIGFVLYVDTSCESHETDSGATYINTANGKPGISGITKTNCNRTDDPLGADAANLCYTDAAPVTATELQVSGEYKTEYITGEALDLTGMELTVVYSDGSTKTISPDDVTVSEFDAQKVGEQKLTVSYEGLTAIITVRFKAPQVLIQVTVSLLGDDSHGGDGTVHTLTGGGLKIWSGPVTYTVDSNDTVWQVLQRLLDEKGYSYANPSGNYVESVNGLSEIDNGPNSGWMYTLNGAYTRYGVSQQHLKDGDVIVFHYTDDYTKEKGGIGADAEAAENVDKLIGAIGTVTLDSGDEIAQARDAYDALTGEQKKQVDLYDTLTAAEAAYAQLKAADDQAKADAVAALIAKIDAQITLDSEKEITDARKAYDALTEDQKKLVGSYDTLTAAEHQLAKLKADEADKERAQKVMDMIEELEPVTLSSEEAIHAARNAYDTLTDGQKALVTNLSKLESAEEKLAKLKSQAAYEDAYQNTGDSLNELGTPVVGSVGGEWTVIGLVRSDRDVPAGYFDAVVQFVKENINDKEQLHRTKSTENSRLILALTAIGKDVTNVDGHNLLVGLSDMAYIRKQGINGPIWALIAFDCHNYAIPAGDVTREALIGEILNAQLPDGGWALSGEEADPDMTAMAVQALAPYYDKDAKVKAAIDSALNRLSALQTIDGGYESWDTPNSESCAQVLVALTALGIDPQTDPRFIKNGCSVLDALMAYYTDGGFRHTMDGEQDAMATEQGYLALTAYARLTKNEAMLYDMSDVTVHVEEKPDVNPGDDDPTDPTEPSDGDQTEPTKPNDGDGDPIPETGENAYFAVYFGLMLAALAGLTVAAATKRRKYHG